MLIIKGKSKVLTNSERGEGVLDCLFTDNITAYNSSKSDTIEGKGKALATISGLIMRYLGSKGVMNHFIDFKSENEHYVRKLTMIPLEIVVRNYAYGSLCKRECIEPGRKLKEPRIDIHYKSDELGDPIISCEDVISRGIVSRDAMEDIIKIAHKINLILTDFFISIGIKFADTKFEFGLSEFDIVLGDEIGCDSSRLINLSDSKSLDKDIYRGGGSKHDILKAYFEVCDRVRKAL